MRGEVIPLANGNSENTDLYGVHPTVQLSRTPHPDRRKRRSLTCNPPSVYHGMNRRVNIESDSRKI